MSVTLKCLNKSETSNSRSNSAMHLSCDSTTMQGVPANMSHPQMNSMQGMQRNVPAGAPPPIPPRPQATQVSNYRTAPPVGMNSYYSYGRYPLSHSYTSYGNYGNFGYGMPRYGYSHGYPPSWGEMGDAESAFLRMAEESSRPAFQSIESLVTAVGSISMMLDSTYHAVYNSYRAVLGVVESFSRLKNHLAHVLSTLALLRTFQWLIQQVLFYLRLRKTNPSVEAAWSAATAVSANSLAANGAPPPQSSWPILLFLSVVFGAPWLIFRIFSKLALKKQLGKQNDIGEICHAYALFDFRAANPTEISLRPGQHLTIAPRNQQPKVKGWILVIADNNAVGIVPANYIRVYRRRPVKQKSADGVTETEMESAFETVGAEAAPKPEVNDAEMAQ